MEESERVGEERKDGVRGGGTSWKGEELAMLQCGCACNAVGRRRCEGRKVEVEVKTTRVGPGGGLDGDGRARSR